MSRDGRGQLLQLSWPARCLRWITSNPLMGLIGILLAGLGASRLRVRHLESKAERAQKAADLARLKLSRETAMTREQEHARTQAAVSDAIAAGLARQDEAKDRADQSAKKLRDIGKRWPTSVILLAALWIPALAAETALPDACASQPDLTGLSAALEASEGRFSGLDRMMVTDAASGLDQYRALVAALCDRVATLTSIQDSAITGRTLALAELSRCGEDRTACWNESEARIRKPVITRRGRFLNCVAGASLGAGLDGEGFLGISVTCGPSILP